MKTVQWEPSCTTWMDRQTHGQMDRQTDMTKLIISFCNFGNTPEKENLPCPNFLATNITCVSLYSIYISAQYINNFSTEQQLMYSI